MGEPAYASLTCVSPVVCSIHAIERCLSVGDNAVDIVAGHPEQKGRGLTRDAGDMRRQQQALGGGGRRGEQRIVGDPGNGGVKLAVEGDEVLTPLLGRALVGQNLAQGAKRGLVGALGSQSCDAAFGDESRLFKVLQRAGVGLAFLL